jgi:hypothetical protein
MNSYFTNVGSYMQPTDPNELARLSPSFQNIAGQQANQNMAMQQGNQLTQQAGQTGQQSGGMNPMAMAMALRKGSDQKAIDAANTEMAAFNNRPAQNYYSAGMNPMSIVSDY